MDYTHYTYAVKVFEVFANHNCETSNIFSFYGMIILLMLLK